MLKSLLKVLSFKNVESIMMLDAPFYRQNTPFNCGPVALRMVLAYLDKDPGIEILE